MSEIWLKFSTGDSRNLEIHYRNYGWKHRIQILWITHFLETRSSNQTSSLAYSPCTADEWNLAKILYWRFEKSWNSSSKLKVSFLVSINIYPLYRYIFKSTPLFWNNNLSLVLKISKHFLLPPNNSCIKFEDILKLESALSKRCGISKWLI